MITTYQTSGALVDPDSRETEFTVLRYHVTSNNKCTHKSQEHKITYGKALGVAALPGTPP